MSLNFPMPPSASLIPPSMKFVRVFFAFVLVGSSFSLKAQIPSEPVTRTYRVQQNVTLSDIPLGAKSVKWRISIPDDDRYQEVLDFSVASVPGSWRVVTEPDRGYGIER